MYRTAWFSCEKRMKNVNSYDRPLFPFEGISNPKTFIVAFKKLESRVILLRARVRKRGDVEPEVQSIPGGIIPFKRAVEDVAPGAGIMNQHCSRFTPEDSSRHNAGTCQKHEHRPHGKGIPRMDSDAQE